MMDDDLIESIREQKEESEDLNAAELEEEKKSLLQKKNTKLM